MTFDEWAVKNWWLIDVKDNARVIWESALLEEREACAVAAENLSTSDAYEIAHIIRARG